MQSQQSLCLRQDFMRPVLHAEESCMTCCMCQGASKSLQRGCCRAKRHEREHLIEMRRCKVSRQILLRLGRLTIIHCSWPIVRECISKDCASSIEYVHKTAIGKLPNVVGRMTPRTSGLGHPGSSARHPWNALGFNTSGNVLVPGVPLRRWATSWCPARRALRQAGRSRSRPPSNDYANSTHKSPDWTA